MKLRRKSTIIYVPLLHGFFVEQPKKQNITQALPVITKNGYLCE